jgi:heptosyltransferase I
VPVRLRHWSRSPLESRADMRRALGGMRGFDVAVDFQGLIKSAALGWVARTPVRYGFAREVIREKAAAMFTNRHVLVDRGRHVVDWNRELAEAVVANRAPAVERWSDFASDPNRKVEPYAGRIVLLPGAGKPGKQWPADRFRRVVDRFPGRTVVAWGPGERPLAEAIGGEIAPDTNLRELAALLRGAALVVGGDTGPLHLAAALGTKVVGLFGPTDPRRNGPYGQIASTVDHFRAGGRSMESIEADEVIERMEERLG